MRAKTGSGENTWKTRQTSYRVPFVDPCCKAVVGTTSGLGRVLGLPGVSTGPLAYIITPVLTDKQKALANLSTLAEGSIIVYTPEG